jgi:hypothetical protein
MPDIFDQVVYTNTRARGWITWNPNPETDRTLGAIERILREYRDYLPMTARQIFYRLIGQNQIIKTEQSYQRLLAILTKARRSGRIDFSAIRDDGTVSQAYAGWDDPEQWLRSLLPSACRFQRDLRQNQDVEVEVWVEAAGMVPQVAQMAYRYGVSTYSSGGFDSLTVKYQSARRILGNAYDGRPTVVLHVGDLDPSGVALFNAAREDVNAFVRHEGESVMDWVRVAVNLDHIEEYGLETAPPKPRKDNQNLPGGWEPDWPTVQAEAFAPDVLIGLIEDEIKLHVDGDILEETRAQSRLDAARLVAAVEGIELSDDEDDPEDEDG